MKKVLLLTIAMMVGLVANAQDFTKGTKTFSANATGLDFGVTKVKDADDIINFGIVGKGSYFVIDNLAITAGLGFDYEKMGDVNTNAFAFEVGAKYYFYNALYAGVGYQGLKAKDVDLASFAKVEVGYDIYISERVFFAPAVYFQKGFGDTAKDITSFGLSVGVGVNF